MTAAFPLPTPAPGAASEHEAALLEAARDLATDWLCWAMVTHRDGRVFAGRVGDYRALNVSWMRIDVPAGPTAGIYMLQVAAVEDWHLCSEDQAQQAARLISHASFSLDSAGALRVGQAS